MVEVDFHVHLIRSRILSSTVPSMRLADHDNGVPESSPSVEPTIFPMIQRPMVFARAWDRRFRLDFMRARGYDIFRRAAPAQRRPMALSFSG
jgi:hypothetical protein